LFPKQRPTIATQEHILLHTLAVMESMGGCTGRMWNRLRQRKFSCFRFISSSRNACFGNFV